MGEVIGRAGFHATHAKSVSERGAILHEMMRELDPDAIAYWAARNPSIVPEDEVLNEAYVNDGAGGFTRCKDKQEVLDYGAARLEKVSRKIRQDEYSEKTKKMQGGTVTTSMIVTHLPKSMCQEIPNFYPRLDEYGNPKFDDAGKPLMRSRWVARDRDEARKYFQDVHDFLTENVVPGGQAATLGFDIQHSESTPHAQFLMDTFAPDPKRDGVLKASASEAWFAHRDVKDATGKVKTGPAKLSDYHAGLKEHLINLGYDISPDFDETRRMIGYTKEDYERVQESKAESFRNRVNVRLRESNVHAKERDLDTLESELNDHAVILKTREKALKDAKEQAEASQHRADIEAGRILAEARSYAEKTREDAQRVARDSDIGKWLAQNDPQALKAYEDSLKSAVIPRSPMVLREFNLKVKTSRELLVTVVGRYQDKSVALDVELRASDPEARGQRGLHLTGISREGKPLQTHAKYPQAQFDLIKAAAGSNHIRVGDQSTYAVKGDLMSRPGMGIFLNTKAKLTSSQQPITADWEALQQKSEEMAQAETSIVPGRLFDDYEPMNRGNQYGD